MSSALPHRPSLEHLKRQARAELRRMRLQAAVPPAPVRLGRSVLSALIGDLPPDAIGYRFASIPLPRHLSGDGAAALAMELLPRLRSEWRPHAIPRSDMVEH
jgi:hypothetical protein